MNHMFYPSVYPQIVLDFIENFAGKPGHERQQVIETFTCGCCFWFARILQERFKYSTDEIFIVYDDVMNHFGCEINRRVYDITGDVTDKYNWEPFQYVVDRDTLHAAHIFHDCIEFATDKEY